MSYEIRRLNRTGKMETEVWEAAKLDVAVNQAREIVKSTRDEAVAKKPWKPDGGAHPGAGWRVDILEKTNGARVLVGRFEIDDRGEILSVDVPARTVESGSSP